MVSDSAFNNKQVQPVQAPVRKEKLTGALKVTGSVQVWVSVEQLSSANTQATGN